MQMLFLYKDSRLNTCTCSHSLLTPDKTKVKGVFTKTERTRENSSSYAVTHMGSRWMSGKWPNRHERSQPWGHSGKSWSSTCFTSQIPLQALELEAPGHTRNRGQLKAGLTESLGKQLEFQISPYSVLSGDCSTPAPAKIGRSFSGMNTTKAFCSGEVGYIWELEVKACWSLRFHQPSFLTQPQNTGNQDLTPIFSSMSSRNGPFCSLSKKAPVNKSHPGTQAFKQLFSIHRWLLMTSRQWPDIQGRPVTGKTET